MHIESLHGLSRKSKAVANSVIENGSTQLKNRTRTVSPFHGSSHHRTITEVEDGSAFMHEDVNGAKLLHLRSKQTIKNQRAADIASSSASKPPHYSQHSRQQQQFYVTSPHGFMSPKMSQPTTINTVDLIRLPQLGTASQTSRQRIIQTSQHEQDMKMSIAGSSSFQQSNQPHQRNARGSLMTSLHKNRVPSVAAANNTVTMQKFNESRFDFSSFDTSSIQQFHHMPPSAVSDHERARNLIANIYPQRSPDNSQTQQPALELDWNRFTLTQQGWREAGQSAANHPKTPGKPLTMAKDGQRQVTPLRFGSDTLHSPSFNKSDNGSIGLSTLYQQPNHKVYKKISTKKIITAGVSRSGSPDRMPLPRPTARESSLNIGSHKKPHPARLLQKKADTLLDKFRRKITEPIESDDESSLVLEKQKTSAMRVSSREQVERIVSDNQAHYINKVQPKSLKRHHMRQMEQRKTGKKADLSALTQLLKLDDHKAYQMPNQEVMRLSLREAQKLKKQKILDELSMNQVTMQGMLSVKEMKIKEATKNKQQTKMISDYLLNFSTAAEIVNVDQLEKADTALASFANAFTAKIQENFIKVKLYEALRQKMHQAAQDRKKIAKLGAVAQQRDAQEERILHQKGLFHVENSERWNPLEHVANMIQQNLHYQKRLKQRVMEENYDKRTVSVSPDQDPRIKFMRKCEDNMEHVLPILDKVYMKTLCLQNYHLSEVHCQGLADACQYLDHKKVNRMLFNNCSMTGDSIAIILDGIAKLPDFKAFTYKLNAFNALSVEKLSPLLKRGVPNHLQELQLIDVKMSPTIIELLMDTIIEFCRIRKFSLVNVSHNEASFEKVVEYVRTSLYLNELDLSCSGVRPKTMLVLLREIKHNSQLINLCLSFNQLLEQQSMVLTEEQIAEGHTDAVLSPFNQEVVECFNDFIKYNIYLLHLDLQATGLIPSAIKYIVSLLRKSQALRCLHLCGNKGMDEDLISWVRDRIHAKPADKSHVIQPSKTQYQIERDEERKIQQQEQEAEVLGDDIDEIEKEEAKAAQTNTQPYSFLTSLMGSNKDTKKKRIGGRTRGRSTLLTKQQAIRQGVKLRGIYQSVKMQDQSVMLQNFDACRLIIQRDLGFKDIIPGSAQWRVQTEVRDECWFCNQSTLTVFLWKPRIGQLTSIKDPETISHYSSALKKRYTELDIRPHFYDGCPVISGPFTNWRPVKMRSLRTFLQQNDKHRPNFTYQAAREGNVREVCIGPSAEPLNEEEKAYVKLKEDEYYSKHWHKIIMPFLRYKNPSIASTEQFSFKNISVEIQDPLFFHVDMVKPGRSTYVVQLQQQRTILKMQDTILFSDLNDGDADAAMLTDEEDLQTYVHQNVNSFRQESIPVFYNKRKIVKVEREAVPTKQMHKDWKVDTPETIAQIFKNDYGQTLIDQIVTDAKENAKIQTEIQNMMPIFLDIFHILQARSKNYPLIDEVRVREDIINRIKLTDSTFLMHHSLGNIVKETCVQTELPALPMLKHLKSRNLITRSILLELFFRFSTFLFTNQQVMKGGLKKIVDSYADQNKPFASKGQKPGRSNRGVQKNGPSKGDEAEEEVNEYQELSLSQAFYLFIETKIKPLHTEMQVKWQSFRDDELWVQSVQRVFTLNEVGIRALYDKYVQRGYNWLTISDCEELMVKDSPLEVSLETVRQAFAMSKQTVVNERDEKQFRQYNKLTFVEFLEFLGRITDMVFEGSELEEIPLDEKLEYSLHEWLPLVNHKYQRNQIVTHEFSDSDDEY